MRKLVCGVGINDANYVVQPTINGKRKWCNFYRAWLGMMNRSYSKKYHKSFPTYIGVTVCKEWHSFMAFREWMMHQDWEEKELDKDLIVFGNKEYGPNTCMFVSNLLNSLMTAHTGARGDYPIGVCFHSRDGVFQAQCRAKGKRHYLGSFKNKIEAHRAWQIEKINQISILEREQTKIEIINALNRISKKIKSDYDNNLETII